MVQIPAITLTLEEFLQQPETKPASEYIDGQVFQKPMPELAHAAIQGDLAAAIDLAMKGDSLGRLRDRKARAFPELRCVFAGRAIVPDVAVLPWSAIPRGENGKISGEFLAAPDWMIEILSPDQSQTKLVKKILHALEHGTQMGWLIDPAEECIFVYTPDRRTVLYEEPTAQLPVPEFASGFSLTVGELVAWLYE
jgi:Uma2 family endonuclease